MLTFPNEYQPDNTDDRELAEYAAELLREINNEERRNHYEHQGKSYDDSKCAR